MLNDEQPKTIRIDTVEKLIALQPGKLTQEEQESQMRNIARKLNGPTMLWVVPVKKDQNEQV